MGWEGCRKKIWFARTARRYKPEMPLHHGSAWRHLTEAQWRHYVFQLVQFLDPPILPGNAIFEVGVGSGAVLHTIRERNADLRVAGVDPEWRAVKIASAALPDGDFKIGDGRDLSMVGNDRFDHVISHGVIIYLENLDEADCFVREMIRVAKPGASLMITSMIEPGGIKQGSGIITIPQSWWARHVEAVTVSSIQVIGDLPGCEHQEDRYAVYLKKNH